MIRLNGVTVTARKQVLLSEVGFQVPEGLVFGVYGPNGAGKSTLLRALAGVLDLDHSGSIQIDGVEISSRMDPSERCRKVLRLGSDFHSSFGVRVGDLFKLAVRSGGRAELVSDIINRLGLADWISRDFGSLSDGQKQWVMFGRALVQDPRVLVLDETFSKLDLDRLMAAGELIRRRVDSGGVVVVASHDLNRLVTWSDRLLLLGSGRIVAEGPVTDVFTSENLKKIYPNSSLEIDPQGRLSVKY
jgi:ABC-type cobalamin/Fe3+-siderophores transport system ATPase subunit